ncbi:peptidoglycan editing factor PgeF [Actinocorallia longicatena]|uniref:Peptidoglycan editing factor PgeF n=1 Tax=Actinocorallia longicatena TaxID=111803 RepID=A0ABP6QKN2_9ACTN
MRTAVTDRSGGFSAAPYGGRNLGGNVGDDPATVARNREKTAAELGVERLAFMRQIHSARVERLPRGDLPECDAIFTDVPGLALGALGADCPAILVGAENMVGAAHSGRVGTLLGVGPALVEAMRAAGATGPMTALIGPAACGRCYEVPEAMRAEAPEPMRSTTSWGTPALDLRAALAVQLAALDVTVEHDPRCTIEAPELYSYRRDGVTGRFAGLVWLEPA